MVIPAYRAQADEANKAASRAVGKTKDPRMVIGEC